MRYLTILATAGLMVASAAEAGPQYVDDSKFALSGYDTVAYFSLEQAPIGETQPEAVPGNTGITAEHNGAIWAFSSEENRDKFQAEPEKYAPQYDGHCTFGVAQGGKMAANPNLWRIIDSKLYFNITPTVVGFFEADIQGNLAAAESNWGGLEQQDTDTSMKSWKAINDNDGTYTKTAPFDG